MKTQFEQMMDGLNDVEAFLTGEQEAVGCGPAQTLTEE
jgi:hypothetical protein